MIDIKALIVSSYGHLASCLQILLAHTPGISVLPHIHDQGRLPFILRHHTPDLIFMSLDNASSLWADLFLHAPPYSQVIAITPDPVLAPRAFTYNCADILTAPFQPVDLRRAVSRALFRRRLWHEGKELPPEGGPVFPLPARKKGVIRFFDPAEILYFKAEHKYVFLHTLKKEQYFCRFTLKQLETLLNPRQFCRVRRNVIVALHGIRKVEKKGARDLTLHLKGPCSVEIRAGRKYIPSLRERLRL